MLVNLAWAPSGLVGEKLGALLGEPLLLLLAALALALARLALAP
jgi:hypothetical protein